MVAHQSTCTTVICFCWEILKSRLWSLVYYRERIWRFNIISKRVKSFDSRRYFLAGWVGGRARTSNQFSSRKKNKKGPWMYEAVIHYTPDHRHPVSGPHLEYWMWPYQGLHPCTQHLPGHVHSVSGPHLEYWTWPYLGLLPYTQLAYLLGLALWLVATGYTVW